MHINHNRIKEISALYLAERKPFIKNSSFAHYWEIANNYIYPFLGEMTFDDLSISELNRYIGNLKSKGKTSGKGGLSDKTIKDVITLLKSIFEYAIDNCYCSNSVIFPKMRNIKQKPSTTLVLSPSDQTLLEEYILGNLNPLYSGIILSLYTGMRIGEICALTWEDIDVENSLISVNKTILRIKNTDECSELHDNHIPKTVLTINTPKTDTSERIIPLPRYINERIKTLIKQRSSRDNQYYVLSDSDKPIEPRDYYKKYKKILSACGITTNYTFHALRHTYATRCVEQNVDPKIISELLGHSNVSITLNTYVHPTMKMKRESVEKLVSQ